MSYVTREDLRTMDLGISDVHVQSPVKIKKTYTYECDGKSYECDGEEDEVDMIDAETRKSLSADQFALSEQRKIPIDTAERVRNASARLEQQKKSGNISDSDYSKARDAISRAAKKHEDEMDMSLHVPTHAVITPEMSTCGELSIVLNIRGDIISLDDVLNPENKRVWIQVAKQGKFKGHVAGPFEMNEGTFKEIIQNFKNSHNRLIPVDFEHASEQESTSGSIPIHGAPAQGWIHDLKIGSDGNLWGLVEWLTVAKDYIQKKQYKFLSPAVVFGARDRVTGKPIGARLSSVALTNNPFLDGMAPLAAKHREVNPENGGASQGDRPEVVTMDLNKQVTDLSTSLAETKITLSDRETKLVEMKTQLADTEAKAKASEVKVAELTLSLKEEATKRETVEEELKTLRDWKEKEETRRFDERLTEAYDTYKDARKLTDADRDMMAVFLKSEPVKFDARFPKITADKKHMMRDISGDGDKKGKVPPTTVPAGDEDAGGGVVVNLADLSLALSRQKNIPLDQAQRIVTRNAAAKK